MRDYYAVLGVTRDASQDEIKQAWRKSARRWHPDVNDEPRAAEHFQSLNRAHKVLSDPGTRALYDRYGEHWEQAQQAAAQPGEQDREIDPEDLRAAFGGDDFSQFFWQAFRDQNAGSGWRLDGRDIELPLPVTLEELFRGGQRSLLTPAGRRVDLRIPRGARATARLRLAGLGRPGHNGGSPGDLYLRLEALPHARFTREGDDLRASVDVDVFTLMAGGGIEIAGIDGRPLQVKVPAVTQSGRVFRLRGQGMPRADAPDTHGDLLLRVDARLPDTLSEEEQELLRQLRERFAARQAASA